MIHEFSRIERMAGKDALSALSNANVILFGVGGVGSYAAEAIARSGIRRFTLVDNDTVSLTNINRQLIALHSTIGRSKTEVMRDRILDIHPQAEIVCKTLFYASDTASEIILSQYDFIVDAIDSVDSKVLLIMEAMRNRVPIVSCMGTGNKWNPAIFKTGTLNQTKVCPLARILRRKLKDAEIPVDNSLLTVVYSEEEPTIPCEEKAEEEIGNRVPGSMPFVPPVAGMIAAGVVIRHICGKRL